MGIKKAIKTTIILVIILFVAFFARVFLFELMRVPSGSMENTLLVGDIIIMGKLNYGTRVFKKNKVVRSPAFSQIKRMDIVIFNHPVGDTALSKYPEDDYYEYAKRYGRKTILDEPHNYGHIVFRKINERKQFVKRCIGIPGDTVQVYFNKVIVNNKPIMEPETVVPFDDFYFADTNTFQLKYREYNQRNEYFRMFPNDFSQFWTESFIGPLYVPKAGETIKLDLVNISLYKRIIATYEKNAFKMEDSVIYINNQPAQSYTFKENYYYVVGDNRCCSRDSRYWGFVPEDHIKGKAVRALCSFDKGKTRWGRVLKKIR